MSEEPIITTETEGHGGAVHVLRDGVSVFVVKPARGTLCVWRTGHEDEQPLSVGGGVSLAMRLAEKGK